MAVDVRDDLTSTLLPSESVAEFADRVSADAIAAILQGENVHTNVEPVGHVAGMPSRYRVLVDPRQEDRARWILRENEISDSELTFLATGDLPDRNES